MPVTQNFRRFQTLCNPRAVGVLYNVNHRYSLTFPLSKRQANRELERPVPSLVQNDDEKAAELM